MKIGGLIGTAEFRPMFNRGNTGWSHEFCSNTDDNDDTVPSYRLKSIPDFYNGG